MSLVTYNDIVLPMAYITQFTQEAKRDDSDTDWHLTKFDIEIQTLINLNYLSLLAPDLVVAGRGVTANPAEIMKVIRSRLLTHRKTLSIKFNDKELIPQKTGGPGTVDVANGPKPIYCTPVQLTNTTWLLSYKIQASYWENNLVAPQGNPIVTNRTGNNVLYNRWTETHSIDNRNFSKRTRQGKYIIRSDNPNGFIADQLRVQMAVLGVPRQCLRESSQYTVSPDGLGISYTIIDKEVYKMPPSPAFEADGYFRESLNRMGAVRSAECYVSLKGDKLTNQALLIRTAIAVCASKLFLRNRVIGIGVGMQIVAPFNIFEGGHCKVGLYDNVVEVMLRASVAADADNHNLFNAIHAFTTINTSTPGSDNINTYTPPYLAHGTVPFLLQAAAYYDPSLTATRLNAALGQLTAGLEVGQAGKELEP